MPVSPSPTPEQFSIITAVQTTQSNLIVSSVPGSGKTTTLELIVKALPVAPILCLAFNKKIAEEMAKRLPSHAVCKTLNSVGHSSWGNVIGKRLTLDDKKCFKLLSEAISNLSPKEREFAQDYFSENLAAIRKAKVQGYIPDHPLACGTSLILRKDFFNSCEDEVSPSLVDKVLIESISSAYHGTIDFNDQIYMPTLFGGTFPRYPTVLVDEAQDLSVLNLSMLEQLARRARLFVVGDPNQSIYAFRSAYVGSMDYLRTRFNMVEFPLSVSFRCPSAIVKSVWFRAPHMKWIREGGHVESLERLSISAISDSSAFICRNNSPLLALALRLISSGIGCQLVGTDLGPSLIKVLKKLGPLEMEEKDALEAISQWEAQQIAKGKASEGIHDRAECLHILIKGRKYLGLAIDQASSIFQNKGTIHLLTGHKSKGLEWDTVYHLDPWRCSSKYAKTKEEREQELNLRFVIQTRAKENLFEIDLERICI